MITPDGRLTYQEAETGSAISPAGCRRRASKGSRVGLFFPNGIDWISWWLALSRIGALVVPLSTLYAPGEIAKVLRLADIGLLIAPAVVLGTDVGERFEAALPELRHQDRDALSLTGAPYLRRIVFTAGHRVSLGDPVGRSDPTGITAGARRGGGRGVPADLAIMVHTSGSTADPPRACCTPTAPWCARRRVGPSRSVRSPDPRTVPESCAPCPSSGSADCSPRWARCTTRSACW